FMSCELLSGRTLKERLGKTNTLPVAEAIWVMTECARGLAAMHECKLVHQDVKPGNIFLTTGGTVKLLALGLTYSPRRSGMIIQGQTPEFASPEHGSELLCPASDLFSLGATIYLALTGQPPFPDGAPREGDRPPPPVRRFNRRVPRKLEQIL